MAAYESTEVSEWRCNSPKNFEVTVTNLIQKSVKRCNSHISVGALISKLTRSNRTLTNQIQLRHGSRILDDHEAVLSDIIPQSNPVIRCVNGITISFFSKQHKQKEYFVFWEDESVEEVLSRLKTHPCIMNLRDAVIVGRNIRLGNQQGNAVDVLRADDLIEVSENVLELFVTVVTACAQNKQKITMLHDQTMNDVGRRLNLHNYVIIHEGYVSGIDFFSKYENEDSQETVFAHESIGYLSSPGNLRKGMRIVGDYVLRPAGPPDQWLPALKAVTNIRLFVLNTSNISECDFHPDTIKSFKVILYGLAVRRPKDSLPLFLFRSGSGYTTIYKSSFFKDKRSVELAHKDVQNFILLVEADEIVRNEFIITECHTCRKIKVWVTNDDVWVQRFIPYKSCRHFIPNDSAHTS